MFPRRTGERRDALFAAYSRLIPMTMDYDTLDFFAEEIEENELLSRREKDLLHDMIEARQSQLTRGFHKGAG